MTGMSREEALWAELVDEAGEELVEAAASVSVEQAEAELRAAGFDVEAENARAEAFLAWLEGTGTASDAGLAAEADALIDRAAKAPAPGEKVVPIAHARRKRRPVGAWVAAAAAVAAGAVVYVETQLPMVGSPAPPSSSSETPGSPDTAAAVGLRRRAADAFEAGRAAECLSLLDEARAKDPAGDATPEVAQLRKRAEAAVRGDPK
jgi:hypothetical protein